MKRCIFVLLILLSCNREIMMNKNFYEIRRIGILAGTDIETAVGGAINYAKENQCDVRFDFNGVEMEISYSDSHITDTNRHLNHYHQKLKENSENNKAHSYLVAYAISDYDSGSNPIYRNPETIVMDGGFPTFDKIREKITRNWIDKIVDNKKIRILSITELNYKQKKDLTSEDLW